MEPFSILSLFSLLWRSPSTFRHLWCTANCPLPDQGPEMPKGFNCTKCQFGSNVLTKPLLPAEQKARTIADAIGTFLTFLLTFLKSSEISWNWKSNDFLKSIGTLLRTKLEIRPMPAPMRSAPAGASAVAPGTMWRCTWKLRQATYSTCERDKERLLDFDFNVDLIRLYRFDR